MIIAVTMAPRFGIAMVWYAVPVGWFLNWAISYSRYRTGKWKLIAENAVKEEKETGENDMSEKIREALTFTGRVQGVGFRYKMYYLAQQYGVTGWVRNEYDGSVSAQAQGREEEIDRVIQALSGDRYIEIDHVGRRPYPSG